ncbi:MAG TPA: BON domain-containing protein [Mariprofundaceae bacterium]|nr:BON domain-containing protein [Mariprofundaceae bacterium]
MHRFSFLYLGLIIVALPGCLATAIVGGTTVAGSTINDERSLAQHLDDSAIATKVDTRLMLEKDMPSRWVSVEVIDGTAILTGYLPTQQHIDRAIHIVTLIHGVKDVRSELKIGSPQISGYFSDTWITSQVKSRLWDDKEISGFSIHVETVDGRVYLQGIVNLPKHRQRAVQIAKLVDGVTGVVDLMKSDKP